MQGVFPIANIMPPLLMLLFWKELPTEAEASGRLEQGSLVLVSTFLGYCGKWAAHQRVTPRGRPANRMMSSSSRGVVKNQSM